MKNSISASSPRLTVLSLLALGASTACGGDDAPTSTPDAGPRDFGVIVDTGVPDETIVEIAAANGLSSLIAAAETAGLAETLGSPGAFTLFAPTNAAFDALAGAAPSDPDLLANVLLHHVLPFQSDSSEVLESRSLRNSAGLRLPVDAAASPPTVGGAALGPLDLFASNGVVHVIDRVLIPPTIPELVSADVRTSTLAAALQLASPAVRDAVAAPGPVTVFAPINSAFASVDLDAIVADPSYLDQVLQFHVTSGHVSRGELQDGQRVAMANGQFLTVRIGAGDQVVLVDGQSRTSRIVTPDVRLLNGVVHLIDRVMLPSRDAVDIVETLRRSNLNGLATAATAANLASTLSTGGPFTVFAPTDAAFAALGAATPTDPDLLANVLLNHVVAGSRTTPALARTPTLPTLAGPSLLFDFGTDPATVNGADFTTTTDQVATNGVVHAINRVLVPPLVSGAPRLYPQLSTVNAALNAASQSIRDVISGPGPVTVFMPVNSAFEGIDVPALVADQGRLDEILSYHAANGQVLSTELTDGQLLTMSSGVPVTIRVDRGAVSLIDGTGNRVQVVTADVRLLNGVVHLIDGVLSPGHIVEQARANGLTGVLAAATRANLTTTLRTGGPFTVFAPTNEAFTALGLDLNTLREEVVANILLNHVVPGTFRAMDVLGTAELTSAANLPLAVTSTAGTVRVGGARLGSTLDVEASNGVIHLLDDVIIPPTVVELAASTSDLSTLLTAVDRASALVSSALAPNVLSASDQPVTVFAPVNSAFTNQMIDPATLSAAQLDPILSHHVIFGQVVSSAVNTSANLRTVNQTITLTKAMDGSLTVRDASGNVARVLARDLRALNGVVYLIDRVLIPR